MVECFRYPKPDLRGFSKCDRGDTPGFPEEIDGSGALHAAFLKESRIRRRVQCSVQEIRDAPSFSAQVRSHGKPGQVGEGHPSCSYWPLV
jgi:hypothetical protein